jgi:polyisoprenoid-binding protein YceI
MSATKWILDTAHSNLDFSIRHMMIAKVKGSFESFSAEIEADPSDLTTASISFSVDVASVDTRSVDRDNHLRSADFFEVEKYPKMTFVSKQIAKTGENEYEITGDLTIRDVTRSEKVSVSYEGTGKDPWGNTKVGFSGNTTIKRSDYGLTWNAALETGGVLVGDEVKISFEIQAAQGN